MSRLRVAPSLNLLFAASLAVALLFACQDTPRMTEVDGTASLVTKTLTIIGSGTGDGTVRSSPTGINCTVTNGVVAAAVLPRLAPRSTCGRHPACAGSAPWPGPARGWL